MRPTRRAPGPRSRGLGGQLHPIRHEPLRFLRELHRDHGDVAQFRVLHKSVVSLAYPNHIRHVLQTAHRGYTNASTQTRSFNVLRAFLGNGLLTSEGPYWLRQRRSRCSWGRETRRQARE